MYNRYVPQGDGSYRRSITPEAPRQPPREPERPCEPIQASCPPSVHFPNSPGKQAPKAPMGIGSFLKQLLPRGFDTGDLLVVLLILLMAGDCQEDQNTALLTLALYFFL